MIARALQELQLTSLVLTILAVTPCACWSGQCDISCEASDEVTLMQVDMDVSKAATRADASMSVKGENVFAPNDSSLDFQHFQVQAHATQTLFPTPLQNNSFDELGGQQATARNFIEGAEATNIQTLEPALLELSSTRQNLGTQHTISAVTPLAQTLVGGPALVLCVLASVVGCILLILVSPSPTSSKEDAQQKLQLRWYHFSLFATISMLGPMATDIIIPTFPEMAADLHASDTMTALTMPLNMGVRGVSMIIAGMLSDMVGQKKMMMTSLLLFLGGSIICISASNIQTMVLGRIIQGMGEAGDALIQAVVRMLIDDPVNRMHALSMLAGIQPVVVIIAPLVGSVLAHFLGWRAIFGFLILWALSSLIGYAIVVPETRDDSPKQPVSKQFAVVLGNQEHMFLLVPFALIFSLLFSALCNISFVLHGFGLSILSKGWHIASMPPFVAIGASVTAVAFTDKTKSLFITLRRAMTFECLVLFATLHMGMVFVDCQWIVMACFWSITFSMGLCAPTLATLYLEPLKDSCGLASGILVGAQNLASALIAPFSAAELELHGLRSMLMVLMVIHVVSQTIFWIGFGINHEKWLADDDPVSKKMDF